MRARWWSRFQQIVTFLFLIYVVALLGRSAWKNAKTNQKLTNLQHEIETLQEENLRLTYLIRYEQTEAFRELEARRRLGIKKPGETVIALPPEPTVDPTQPNQDIEAAGLRINPVGEWWKYFVG